MGIFQPFEAHPFHANAFTYAGVGVDETNPGRIGECVNARREGIEHLREEISIDCGNGLSRRIEVADLTRAEEVLRDPARRIAEELLVPAEQPVPNLPGVEAFRARYALTAGDVQAMLTMDPLDATHLLVRAMPAVDAERLPPPTAAPVLPAALAPIAIPVVMFLPTSRDRRG